MNQLGKKQKPLVTVVIPSYNQGEFLRDAIESVLEQDIPLELFVMDGGSTDESVEIIKRFDDNISFWRSHPDDGQSAAINEGVKLGTAPYVCWLNSDDFFYPQALIALIEKLENNPNSPFVYGRCSVSNRSGNSVGRYFTMPAKKYLFANYCYVCQPGTLIRRDCWESLNGLDESLHMAMDYDLWWRMWACFGAPAYDNEKLIASTRAHESTKTSTNLKGHYQESIDVVKKHYSHVPLKWKLAYPLMKIVRWLESKKY